MQENYGDDRVAQIITFGTLQARAVLRDVGRVLQLPLGLVDRLAKMVPNNPANPTTLAKAIEIEPRLRQAGATTSPSPSCSTSPLQLEGLYRNASTHAAGVVIGDRPLIELVPLYHDPRSDVPATQFNMKWVESAGPGEVRLPGPEDPDGARAGRALPEAARRGDRPGPAAAGRCGRPTS